jgi:hypothetical protein
MNGNLVPKHGVDVNGHSYTRMVNPDKSSEINAARVSSAAAPPPVATAAPKLGATVRLDDYFGTPDTSPSAIEYMDEYLQGGDHSNDPVYARADYAEVGEEGITFGVELNDDHMGEVFAGRKLRRESSDDYRQRCLEAAAENFDVIQKVLKDKYSADINADSEETTRVEFFVPYPEGSDGDVSMAYMGEKAESDTKLLDLNNDYSYGTDIQNAIAAEAGYVWKLTDDADRRVGDGYWIKED